MLQALALLVAFAGASLPGEASQRLEATLPATGFDLNHWQYLAYADQDAAYEAPRLDFEAAYQDGYHYSTAWSAPASRRAVPRAMEAAQAGRADREPENTVEAAQAEPLSQTVAQQAAVSPFGESLSDAQLDQHRGASSFSVNDDLNLNLLDAINANNTISGGTTGNNIVSADAFTNTSGMVNLIQNSGNNVVIQSATIVNLDLK